MSINRMMTFESDVPLGLKEIEPHLPNGNYPRAIDILFVSVQMN